MPRKKRDIMLLEHRSELKPRSSVLQSFGWGKVLLAGVLPFSEDFCILVEGRKTPTQNLDLFAFHICQSGG